MFARLINGYAYFFRLAAIRYQIQAPVAAAASSTVGTVAPTITGTLDFFCASVLPVN